LKIYNTVGFLEQFYFLKAHGKYQKCYIEIWISWLQHVQLYLKHVQNGSRAFIYIQFCKVFG
jgi:hypothetical protein